MQTEAVNVACGFGEWHFLFVLFVSHPDWQLQRERQEEMMFTHYTCASNSLDADVIYGSPLKSVGWSLRLKCVWKIKADNLAWPYLPS